MQSLYFKGSFWIKVRNQAPPPNTHILINALAHRGIGCPVYFGLTSLECDKKKWFEIQKVLLGMNFAITDVLRNFTEYPDPGWEDRLPIWAHLATKPSSTWYRSSYFRLEAIDEPKPAIHGAYEGPWDFFLDDETWATTETKI